jgi:hypothetical protein
MYLRPRHTAQRSHRRIESASGDEVRGRVVPEGPRSETHLLELLRAPRGRREIPGGVLGVTGRRVGGELLEWGQRGFGLRWPFAGHHRQRERD